MKILVLGGAGFIGRHTVAALLARGHRVIVGTRCPGRAGRRLPGAAQACERREVHFERISGPDDWVAMLSGVDVVVNAVGILRERGAETYEGVHCFAPRALAAACVRMQVRLIHVSALGLRTEAQSRFITSKLHGEREVAASGADYSIVRPSLLDGEGGFGARWFRRVARWPVHFVPADASGRVAAMSVCDLGEAIAVLCAARGQPERREVELGGRVAHTLREYLLVLRPRGIGRRPLQVTVPAWLARLASHLCDLAHFSPFSFGHLELLRRDNVPHRNLLPELLGAAPSPVGADPGLASDEVRSPGPRVPSPRSA